jgi:hypothetical protein
MQSLTFGGQPVHSTQGIDSISDFLDGGVDVGPGGGGAVEEEGWAEGQPGAVAGKISGEHFLSAL